MSEESRPERAPRRGRRGPRRGASGGRRDDARGTRAPHRPRVSARALEAAADARAAVAVPEIRYPAELPVSARREDIAAAIRDHQVVIVAGETGSGKTTQLPKICLELGRGRAGQIGHTQPRRIAARSVADRIAEEIGTPLGEIVGYQVRFTDQSSDRTLVKVMTDGILLAQIQRDPDLLAYDTLIIDEAHERSLNIDFLLGYLTNLLPRRPDLKVIITSATIDSERFARHFARGGPLPDDADGDDQRRAPVVEVTGRTYPVEILYRPLEGERKGDEKDLDTGIVEACAELMTWGDGDILVFLSGEREIRDAADALAASLGDRARDPRHPRRVEILPLYSRLSAAEQHRVFERHAHRRIVLSTNVAETSLTVPGIHYVVDPGTARISRYSKATKVQRLPIEPISQASANQRSGRAGRLADGIAIRLYAQDDFETRPAFTEPEILRTSLASVILQMIAVGVVSSPEDIARFPFVEPPDTRAIRDGVALLAELGAVATADGRTALTPVGRQLARLPMDPRQARMIVEGAKHGVGYEVAVIAAALSIQDPRERPAERREEADLLHRRFADPSSDLLAYLNLWEHVRERQKALSGNQFRRGLKAEMLHFLRIREWQDVMTQIRASAKELGIELVRRDARPVPDRGDTLRHLWDEDAIHRSVLAGLLSQIGAQDVLQLKASSFTHLRGEARAKEMRKARKRSSNEYLGARGVRFAINPGSPLSKKPPEFVMAAELVETSRLWARDVARIDPAWAEELAGDLAKRTRSEPHWSSKRGAAMATEKVLLYGVPIVADRPVLWGRIDPEGARDLFIRHALVQGEWTTHHRFWRDNQRVLEEAAEIEARSRTRGVIADEETLVAFYDARLPETIVSARHFDRWWKEARVADPGLLTLTLEELVPEHAAIDPALFPDSWPQLDLELPLTYQFEPGTAADGVTVHVPLGVLPRVLADGFDWLVPGLLPELVTATIRALPKAVRRLLVPAPDAARDIVTWFEAHLPAWSDVARAGDMAEPFRVAFTRAVRDLRDVEIGDEAWDGLDERLPSHLRMTFRVVERVGRDTTVRGESHDLALLQRQLAPQARAAVRTAVQRAADAAASGRGGTRGGAGGDARPGATDAGARDGAALPRPASAAIAEVDELTAWPDVDVIPDEVEGTVHGVVARGFPAIVAEGEGVKARAALRVLAEAGDRDARHGEGVRRLLLAEVGLPVKRVTTRWSTQEALALGASPYTSTEALVDDLQLAAMRTLTPGAGAVKDRSAYEALRDSVRPALEDQVLEVARRAAGALAAARELDVEVRGSSSLALLSTLQDLREQSAALVGDGFVRRTPAGRLPHLERYLKAAAHRLEKAQSDPSKDAQLAWQVSQVAEAYETVRTARLKGRPDAATRAALDEVRWMLEELRVSLFAQRLGTDGPVSEQRIRKALAAIG
ncbi:ATP-dependent RNA helicase HrpA [Demequina lignilytica]|uniref:ATP-dependent RNA helicase HrpA n=1 Tax=Demequina lignilytica TaxID=3051663 RepID=A0AB35MJI4_9MICO|nr:ATP-dependent RNA helicase HrpA [Demequina sp. SYSU T0a273]MDN4483949.1 ATP-dependent RNA helicase HrpA [Demequina sp. SYSU T0a273]